MRRRIVPLAWMALSVALGGFLGWWLTDSGEVEGEIPVPVAAGPSPPPSTPPSTPPAATGGPSAAAALDGLRSALDGEDDADWTGLVDAVSRPGLDGAVPPLVELAGRTRDGAVELAVLRALEIVGGPRAVRALADLARRKPGLANQAAVRLSKVTSRQAFGVLEEIIDEEQRRGELAAAAIRALGKTRMRQALPLLLEIARDPADADVLREAIRALGEIADPGALETLERLGRHDERRVRLVAIRALGRIRTPRTVKILESFLAAEPQGLEREVIEDALAALSGQPRSPWR